MIALRGAAAVPTGNPTTSFTVAVPSAVVAGDLLFLLVASRDSTGAGTLAVTDNDTGGNAWSKIGNSTDHKLTLWYKRATSGTASKTVTVSNAVGSSAGALKCFSGADGGATPYTNVVVESNASGDETHAGFTPDNGDSMVCAGIVNYANDNAVTSLAFATLGATTATEKLSTGGLDCGAIFGHVLQSGAAAATGNLTWAQTNGTTYSITWAIKPPASQVVTVNQATETDLAQALTRVKGATLGQSSEADLAQGLSRRKTLAIAQLAESDAAQPITPVKTRVLGQAVEVHVAQAVTWPARRLVAQAIEADVAQSVAARKALMVGQAVEAELAQAIARVKTAAVARVLEVDVAQVVTARKTRVVGQVTAGELAQAIAHGKVKSVGQVVELDLAQSVTSGGQIISLGQSVETDVALAIATWKTLGVGIALETDEAQQVFYNAALLGDVENAEVQWLLAVRGARRYTTWQVIWLPARRSARAYNTRREALWQP